MPDFLSFPVLPTAPGTADDMLDDADELENLLEDAFEQEDEEEAARQQAAAPQSGSKSPTPPAGQPSSQFSPSLVVSPTSAPPLIRQPPTGKLPCFTILLIHILGGYLILCANLLCLGPSLIQTTTLHALETMPRTSAGLIDVESLTPEQHRAYNAYV